MPSFALVTDFLFISSCKTSEDSVKDLKEDEEGVLDESKEEDKKNSKRGRKSAGRKSPWTQVQINDLLDIIV